MTGWGAVVVHLHARRLPVRPSISLRTNGQPRWVQKDAVRAGWAGGSATMLVNRLSGFWLGGRNDGLGAAVVSCIHAGCPCALRFPSGRTGSLVGSRRTR